MNRAEILKVVESHEDYRNLYNNDETFAASIDSICTAVENPDKASEILVNMAYSFQVLMGLIINTITEAGDENTIAAIQNLLMGMSQYGDEENEEED